MYDKVDDGDEFSYENFGLGIPWFHLPTSDLKIRAKTFFA